MFLSLRNREFEETERGFDERPSHGEGAVHVQSHSRRAPIGAHHLMSRGDSPARPQYVTHLVEQANRELEAMERAIFGEAASAGGIAV